jgi:hypothetical protein
MKKLVLVLLVLFVIQGIRAQIWVPITSDLLNLESFRHQATQTIEDDLDNGIDGTDIFAVEGARIYTNLSNLVSGDEEQGDNSSSENTVLIGGTSPIFYKGLKVTAFYGNANETYSIENTMDSTYLEDINADEEWDYRSSRYTSANQKEETSSNTILLNIGKIMSRGREIAFTYHRASYNENVEWEDSADYIAQTLTPSLVTTALWNQFGNTSDQSKMPVTTYALSYSSPFRNWDFRGDIFFATGGETYEGDDFNYYWQDQDPDDISTTFEYLDTVDMVYKYSANANLIGIGGELSDLNNNTGLLWEVGANYGMITGSGDNNQDERRHRIVQSEFTSPYVAVLDSLYTENLTAPISVSGNTMGLNGRIEWQISENVRFGLGCMVNTFSMTLEEDRAYRAEVNSEYDDDDGAGSDPDDYVIVATEGWDATYTQEISANRIAIPAGVEVNFGKNKDWYLRLGAMSVGSKSETTEAYEVDSVYLYEREVTYGDGAIDRTFGTSMADPDDSYTYSSTYQDVIYTYGLGWKPSKNLSLDLIGMFDLSGVEILSTDWLRSLKLSATINVY